MPSFLFIHLEFVPAILQVGNHLLSGGHSGVIVGFGSLSAHFLGSEEYANAKLLFEFLSFQA